MTVLDAIIVIVLNGCIGYCIGYCMPPIIGALMILIADIRDKHTSGKDKAGSED